MLSLRHMEVLATEACYQWGVNRLSTMIQAIEIQLFDTNLPTRCEMSLWNEHLILSQEKSVQ